MDNEDTALRNSKKPEVIKLGLAYRIDRFWYSACTAVMDLRCCGAQRNAMTTGYVHGIGESFRYHSLQQYI